MIANGGRFRKLPHLRMDIPQKHRTQVTPDLSELQILLKTAVYALLMVNSLILLMKAPNTFYTKETYYWLELVRLMEKLCMFQMMNQQYIPLF